jgi:hypothetical protein
MKESYRAGRLLGTFLTSMFFMFLSCDEQLPSYIEPHSYLDGQILGLYVLGNSEAAGNRLSVQFSATNTYEETLDDTVTIYGMLEIRSVRMPHIVRTLQVRPQNIHTGSEHYNFGTRRLTLDPKATITFAVSWDFTLDDRGVDPRQELFIFHEDPECDVRCLAEREEFTLFGQIFFFDQRAPVYATGIVPICYVYPYVGPPGCPAILTDPPCLQAPSPSSPRCNPFSGGDE